MTTNLKISPRAQKALELLDQGATYVEKLETDRYTGRTMFKARLIVGAGAEKGYGTSTLLELQKAGVIYRSYASPSRDVYKIRRSDSDKGHCEPIYDGIWG